MTPLAIAHKVLNGDLSNTFGGLSKGENYLYLDNRDQSYVTLKVDSWMARASLTCISTVEEFINFKGDDVETVYTQEMSDNGVLPSAGMECLVLNNSCSQPKWKKALIKYMGDLVIYAYCENGERCDRKRSLKFKPLTPPIELIDGKAYQFDYGNTAEIIGLYSKQSKQLQAIAGHYESKHCTNIKPLTVEGK
jgi:hypothetical protein